ncbi:unnamed protein product [Effrenium voratum]|uniref:Vacuolar protein 14 C-terminal Fig4-binding domain-containing protein n=1 Tax=Effrenium voratum TaxID=2562239 RepID=A0AA36IEI3_9DINO|nr:unnamed protein product [Effrenium voratum]
MSSLVSLSGDGQRALKPEELFEDAIAQALRGQKTSEQSRKEFVDKLKDRVSEAMKDNNPSFVRQVLDCLRVNCFKDMEDSNNSVYTWNARKSGLMAIGAVAIGLGSKVGDFLKDIMGLLLGPDSKHLGPFLAEASSDTESHRVRYLSCEALFNVAKIAQEELLPYLARIFDGLSRLYADVVADVRHAAQVLDRLLREIVTSHPEKFEVDTFAEEVCTRMKYKNPMIRQLCLGWTNLILQIAQVDLVGSNPKIIQGLFEHLADDHSRDSLQNAQNLLEQCIEKVKASPLATKRLIVFNTAADLAKNCRKEDSKIRFQSMWWLLEYVHFTPGYGPTTSVKDEEVKLWWQKWAEALPQLIDGVCCCIGCEDGKDLNGALLELANLLHEYLRVDELVETLKQRLGKLRDGEAAMVVHIACLQWICLLLVHRPQQMLQRKIVKELFMPIFESLNHANDEVVIASLRVLAQLMETTPSDQLGIEDLLAKESVRRADGAKEEPQKSLFTFIVDRLLEELEKQRDMLETRGRLMIHQLCGHLDPRRLFVTVARAIPAQEKNFAQKLVQTFNWILLTSAETRSLREELLQESERHPQLGHEGEKPLFLELLEPWFHNPASALALCLWSQQYELASELTGRCAAFEPTLDFLQQLDQLVQLIESPIFSRLRLQLLEPKKHPMLLKCLLGLAMLLPQAGAFQALRERMHLVQSSLLLEVRFDSEAPATATKSDWLSFSSKEGKEGKEKKEKQVDLAGLLRSFDKITQQRNDARCGPSP